MEEIKEPMVDVSNSETMVSQQENKNDDNNLLEEAIKHIENGDLYDAIYVLRTIKSQDEDYDKAVTELNRVCELYKEESIASANEHARELKYENAISVLATAAKVLYQDADILEVKEKISIDAVEYYFNQVEENMANMDYSTALDYMNKAVSLQPTEENKIYQESLKYFTDNIYTAENLPDGLFFIHEDKFYTIRQDLSFVEKVYNDARYPEHIIIHNVSEAEDLFSVVLRGSQIAIKGSVQDSYKITSAYICGYTFPYRIGSLYEPVRKDDEFFSGETINGEEISISEYAERQGWSRVGNLYSGSNIGYGDVLQITGYNHTEYFEKEIVANMWVAAFGSDYSVGYYELKERERTLKVEKTQNGYFTMTVPEDIPEGLYEMIVGYSPVFIYIL